MGKSKETTTTQTETKATPTPQELEMQQLQLDQFKRTSGPQTDVQLSGLNLINRLLQGETNLPGFFGQVGQGISPEITSGIVQQSLQDLYPQFQQQGILDSGTAASIAGRTAGDIRRGSAEYNLNNKLNLLNMALGGQAQIQQPLLQQSQMLNNQLAGLRTINQSGTTTQYGMNPFLQSFQQGLGQTFGSPGFTTGGGFTGFKFGGR